MKTNFEYVLDTMSATGFPIPEYVHYKVKEAAVSKESVTDDRILDSREKVWLAAVKLACASEPNMLRNISLHKIKTAASRYNIMDDIDHAIAYVDKQDEKVNDIRTLDDWNKAASWLKEHADALEPDVRVKLAEYLLDKTTKLGHVLSLTEKFEFDQWAGRDPYTPEVRAMAEKNLHKLASGSVYRTDQFAAVSLAVLQETLPELAKNASLGMGVLDPAMFGKYASALPETQADIVDALLTSHGQQPVHSDFGAPVEIDDEFLAAL